MTALPEHHRAYFATHVGVLGVHGQIAQSVLNVTARKAGFGRNIPRDQITALKAARDRVFAVKEERALEELRGAEEAVARLREDYRRAARSQEELSEREQPRLNREEIDHDIAVADGEERRRSTS